MQRIRAFWRDLREEFLRISWPSWKESYRVTLGVLWITVLSMMLLAGVSALSSVFVRQLLAL